MQRKVYQVIEITDQPFHEILVKVNASGRDFWEYYIGVDSSNMYYSTEMSLDESDPRFKAVNNAFKGCTKAFKSISEMQKANPIDGAWLSFASIGTRYDFLKDDLFYYGGGMYINPSNEMQSETACKRDAQIMLSRLENTLHERAWKVQKIAETTIEEVKKKVLADILVPFWTVTSDYQINRVDSIQDHSIGLYDRARDEKGKTYILHGTNYIIDSNLLITQLPKKECTYNPMVFNTYWEAILYKCSNTKLNKNEISSLADLLKSKLTDKFVENLNSEKENG